jgi:hypothetical protein
MVINDIEVTNVTCQSDISQCLSRNGIQVMKAYVVSFVNPDPSLKGNALFWLAETSSFGELKRERGGDATTTIAVITPSSTHNSDHPQNHNHNHSRRGNKEKKKGGMHVPWRCMTLRNFTTTFEDGRMRTWRFPRRSAFTMLFCKTLRSDKKDVDGRGTTCQTVVLCVRVGVVLAKRDAKVDIGRTRTDTRTILRKSMRKCPEI